MIKTIVFDFDGVLVDSFRTFYPLIRDSMNHAGFKLTQGQYRNFFVGNVHEGFKNYINDNKKHLSFSKFRKDNYDKYYYGTTGVKFFSGTVEFLKKVSKNYSLTIASSGKQENVMNLLEKNGVKKLFSLILASSDFSKEDMLREVLNKFQVQPSEVVMITDTVGDVLVAKKVGLKTIAVTWGFHSLKVLEKSNPDFIVGNFKELQNRLID